MEPTTRQFNEGVKVIPGGSQPLTPSTYKPPFTMFPDLKEVPPAKINSSTGPDRGKYIMGSDKYGPPNTVKPEVRPQPNQGTRTWKPGKGPVVIGGSNPGAVPILPAPKSPGRIANFFGGRGGGMMGGGGLMNRNSR
jgi:hypothetical protein